MRRAVRFATARRSPSGASILGSSLLAEWDARFGTNTAGARTWTDQKGGLVLTGSGTPGFTTDGANFRGLSTWDFAAASSQYFDSGGAGPTLIASASANLYCSMVLRATSTADTGVVQAYAGLLDNALSQYAAQPNRPAGAGHTWNCFMCGANAISAPVAGDMAVHLFEMYLSPTGTLKFDIDGVGVADNATPGIVTLAAVQRVNIGGFVSGPNFLSNCRVARLRICATTPTTAQRAQLRTLDRAIWGVP